MSIFDLSLHAANVVYGLAYLGLIVGAVLALAGTAALAWSGNVRERYADDRITKNESDTAYAKADAERAKADAERAKADAAQANQLLEAERLARVKIERQLAPRSLSAEQVADVASKLAPFAGYKVQLWACPPDEEVVRIANAIVAALRSARWEAPLVLARPMSTAPRGMELDVAPDASDVERHAAAALAEALAAEGLAVVGPTVKPLAAPMVMMTGPSAATAATEKTNLRLMIGTK